MRFWYRINHLFEDLYFPFAISLRREEFTALCMDCEKHRSLLAKVVPWAELIFLLGPKSPALSLGPEVPRFFTRSQRRERKGRVKDTFKEQPTSQAPRPHSENLRYEKYSLTFLFNFFSFFFVNAKTETHTEVPQENLGEDPHQQGMWSGQPSWSTWF